jgi:hypothetical protein
MLGVDEKKPKMHRIRIKLIRNNLPAIKGNFIPRTKSEDSLCIEQICTAMRERGGFRGNYHDRVGNVKCFFEEAAYQLCDGFTVNTGYFSIHPVISGTFDSPDDIIDPEKHRVGFRFHVGSLLKERVKDIDVVLAGKADASGYIEGFKSFGEGGSGSGAKGGDMFVIRGKRIKLAGSDPEVGLYFVPESSEPNAAFDGAVKVSRFNQNDPSRLGGMIPELTPGLWRILVKTQYTIGGIPLKKPRTILSRFTVTCH